MNQACRWNDNGGTLLVGVETASENDALLDVSTLKVEVADYDPSTATGLRNFTTDGVASGIMF